MLSFKGCPVYLVGLYLASGIEPGTLRSRVQHFIYWAKSSIKTIKYLKNIRQMKYNQYRFIHTLTAIERYLISSNWNTILSLFYHSKKKCKKILKVIASRVGAWKHPPTQKTHKNSENKIFYQKSWGSGSQFVLFQILRVKIYAKK